MFLVSQWMGEWDRHSQIAGEKTKVLREKWSNDCEGAEAGLIPRFTHIRPGALELALHLMGRKNGWKSRWPESKSCSLNHVPTLIDHTGEEQPKRDRLPLPDSSQRLVKQHNVLIILLFAPLPHSLSPCSVSQEAGLCGLYLPGSPFLWNPVGFGERGPAWW